MTNNNGENLKFPIKIKDVVSRLTQSTQAALQDKYSRLEIQLPPQFDLGLNERSTSFKDNETTKTNREIAKLFLEMFAVLKDTSVVIFPTNQEAKAAQELWSKKKFERNVMSFSERIDIKTLSKTERKNYDEKRMMDPNFNPDLYLTVKPNVPKNTELLVIVAPQPKDYASLMALHQEFGLGTLILLVNPRFVWNDVMDQKIRGITPAETKATNADSESDSEVNVKESDDSDTTKSDKFKNSSFGKKRFNNNKDTKNNNDSSSTSSVASTNQIAKDYQQMLEVIAQFPNSFYYSPPVLANQRLMSEISRSRQILLFHETANSDWYLIEKTSDNASSSNSNSPMNALTAMMTNLVDKLDESKTVKVLLKRSSKPTEEEIIRTLKETEKS